MSKPNHYIIIFTKPGPGFSPIRDGYYDAGRKYPPFPTKKGDLALLYSTGADPDHPMEVSAFGVITNTSETLVRIAPTEFDQPVSRRTLLRLLDPDAAKRMCHLGLTCNRVISISREAFLKTVAAGRAPAFHAQSKML